MGVQEPGGHRAGRGIAVELGRLCWANRQWELEARSAVASRQAAVRTVHTSRPAAQCARISKAAGQLRCASKSHLGALALRQHVPSRQGWGAQAGRRRAMAAACRRLRRPRCCRAWGHRCIGGFRHCHRPRRAAVTGRSQRGCPRERPAGRRSRRQSRHGRWQVRQRQSQTAGCRAGPAWHPRWCRRRAGWTWQQQSAQAAAECQAAGGFRECGPVGGCTWQG